LGTKITNIQEQKLQKSRNKNYSNYVNSGTKIHEQKVRNLGTKIQKQKLKKSGNKI
jgi:hypothetical protein